MSLLGTVRRTMGTHQILRWYDLFVQGHQAFRVVVKIDWSWVIDRSSCRIFCWFDHSWLWRGDFITIVGDFKIGIDLSLWRRKKNLLHGHAVQLTLYESR